MIKAVWTIATTLYWWWVGWLIYTFVSERITRHNRCTGFKLFRFRRTQMEIWFCPKDEIIPKHVHHKIHSTIIFLGGRMEASLGDRKKLFTFRDTFRMFDVAPRTAHGAVIKSRLVVFCNLERWETNEITSAAIDFWSV